MEIVHGERRCGRRYPMELNLRYQVELGGHRLCAGIGKTRNLSSGGVSFHTPEILPVGRCVEVSVQWPVLVYDVGSVELMIFGRIVRSSAGITAVRTTCYEFRRHTTGDERRQVEEQAQTCVA